MLLRGGAMLPIVYLARSNEGNKNAPCNKERGGFYQLFLTSDVSLLPSVSQDVKKGT